MDSPLDAQERGWAASNHQIHRDNCPMCKETEGEAERLRAALRKIRDGGFVYSPTAMAIARSALAGTEASNGATGAPDYMQAARGAILEAERLRAASLERTLEWLEEKWEFPCPACGGGCYRSRAAEKKYCYACGHRFEPEIQRALAGTEPEDEQWIRDAESGKDREVPGNYRYKLADTEAKATK